jgi:tetratricopeptide (TPR) repeat protein
MAKTILPFLLLLIYPVVLMAQSPHDQDDVEVKRTYNQAVIALKNRDYIAASGFLSTVISRKPDYITAYIERGKIYLAQNKLSEATSDFNKALILDKESGEAYFGRAYAAFLQKDYEKSMQDITSAISRGYTEYTAYYYRGIMYLMKNVANSALLDFTFCIDKKSDFAEAYHDRGSARFMLKDLQGAISDYERAIELNPGYALAYSNLGSVKKELGDFQSAITLYGKSLQVDSTQAEVWNKRGVARYLSGDIEGANLDFGMALKYNHHYVFSQNNQAVVLAKNEKYSEALLKFSTLIKSIPEKGEFYLNRGYVKELSGDLDGACTDWNMADSLKVTDAKLYLKDCK